MSTDTENIDHARSTLANAEALLEQTPAFRRLEPAVQFALRRDLSRIQSALASPQAVAADPYAFPLETPNDLMALRSQTQAGSPSTGSPSTGGVVPPAAADDVGSSGKPPRAAATETLAKRAGALTDEINFPQFVAGLVHGTFDAIVDASIRQMEGFANLVSAVAKDVDQFTRENITPNQARDSLAQKYPADLTLDLPGAEGGQPRLRRASPAEDDEGVSPVWLKDFGMEGEELTDDLIETELVPRTQQEIGQQRLQMLATMVLLGMNRVNVKDGSISARVRFRAAATDNALVNYAVSQDPSGQSNWGERGNAQYDQHAMMVSTVGVNVQSDTDLKAELFGEVRINFVSETLPLDQFMDTAKLALLQRNARRQGSVPPAATGESPPLTTPVTPAVSPSPAAPSSVVPAVSPAATTAAPQLLAPAPLTPAPEGGR